MKKQIKYLSISMIIAYLTTSFITWEFIPSHLSIELRGVMIGMVIIIYIITLIANTIDEQ